jgi:hypothetical protein
MDRDFKKQIGKEKPEEIRETVPSRDRHWNSFW